jgi:hypothetical protein
MGTPSDHALFLTEDGKKQNKPAGQQTATVF